MTIKVLDNFVGTAGTDLSAHTPDIDVAGGGWFISSANAVELDGSGGIEFAASGDSCYISAGVTDQIVTVMFNPGGEDNRISICARSSSDLLNTYELNVRPGDLADKLRLFRIVGGVSTSLGTSPTPLFDLNTTYKIQLKAIGTNLEVLVDDVSYITTSDAVITTGNNAALKHQKYVDNAARFFSFEVDDGQVAGNESSVNFSSKKPVFSASITNQAINNEASVSYTANKPLFSSSITNEPVSNDLSVSFTANKPSFSASINNSAGSNLVSVNLSMKQPVFTASIDNTQAANELTASFTTNKALFSASITNELVNNEVSVNLSMKTPNFTVNVQNGDVVVKFNAETNYSQDTLSTNYNGVYLSTNYTQD